MASIVSSESTSSNVPTILNNGIKPLEYKVELDVELSSCSYSFKVDIKFQLIENTKSIRLHWIPKEKSKPIINGIFSNIISTSVTLELETQTILFVFDEDLPISGTLHVEGHSILDDSLCGLYRSAYTDPHTSEKKYMAVTQFEATDARRCFPCIDEPNAKATFELSVIVDRKYDVISNMPLKGKKSIDSNKVHLFFPPSPVMSTYLVALIIGEFDIISTISSNGVRTSIYIQYQEDNLI